MGNVYKGYDEELQRIVAVKVLPPELAHMQSVIHAAARKQLVVLAALDHLAILDDDDFSRVFHQSSA